MTNKYLPPGRFRIFIHSPGNSRLQVTQEAEQATYLVVRDDELCSPSGSKVTRVLVHALRCYSIRSLLIATAVIALFVAMPVRRAILQRHGREWIAAQRGHVVFEHNYGRDSEWYDAGSTLRIPSLAIDLLGVDLFNPVTAVIFDAEELTDLKPLTSISSLRTIHINIEMADDIDFTPLTDLPELRTIHFTEWSFVTSQQLATLRELLPDAEIVSGSNPAAAAGGGYPSSDPIGLRGSVRSAKTLRYSTSLDASRPRWW